MEDNQIPDTKGITSKEDLLKKGQELFGASIKYAVSIDHLFSKENGCMYRDCKGTCEERIMFCSEETVLEVDVCTKHAIYYKNSSHVIFRYKLGYTPIKK